MQTEKRRIEEQGDYVRWEVAAALQRYDVRVILRLISGADTTDSAGRIETFALTVDGHWRYRAARKITRLVLRTIGQKKE